MTDASLESVLSAEVIKYNDDAEKYVMGYSNAMDVPDYQQGSFANVPPSSAETTESQSTPWFLGYRNKLLRENRCYKVNYFAHPVACKYLVIDSYMKV